MIRYMQAAKSPAFPNESERRGFLDKEIML